MARKKLNSNPITVWPDFDERGNTGYHIVGQLDDRKSGTKGMAIAVTCCDGKRHHAQAIANMLNGVNARAHWNPSDPWREHKQHSVSAWSQEVAEGNTRSGYIDWVNSQIEQAKLGNGGETH